MSDIVVTVPKRLWAEWLEEGDVAWSGGVSSTVPAPWEGEMEYGFNLGGRPPAIGLGERVYIVAHSQLRGYAPLVAIERGTTRFGGRSTGFSLVRRGDAVACTLSEPVRGFQGWRYRWWVCEAELPFPDWRTAGVR